MEAFVFSAFELSYAGWLVLAFEKWLLMLTSVCLFTLFLSLSLGVILRKIVVCSDKSLSPIIIFFMIDILIFFGYRTSKTPLETRNELGVFSSHFFFWGGGCFFIRWVRGSTLNKAWPLIMMSESVLASICILPNAKTYGNMFLKKMLVSKG